jgi:C-terminal processing protease CtpA/Prc
MPPLRHPGLLSLTLLLFAMGAPVDAQTPSAQDVERAHRMLGYVRADLKRFYYDSTFGGLDLEARYHVADSSLNGAETIPALFGVIAQFLIDLKDSHTRFVPPRRAARVEYGWSWRIVGDACFIEWVGRDSDAAQKGLARGDRVLAIDGMLPNRQTSGLIAYLYYQLNPRPGMHVAIEKPDGTRHEVDVLAKVTPGIRVEDFTSMTDRSRMMAESEAGLRSLRHRTRSFGDTVLVWRMRQFIGGDEQAIDDIMDMARSHRALILDLRDNPGGSVATELRLLGHFFDRETRVLTVRTRDKREPRLAKPARREPYRGNVIILINANSASASEITSRVLQLEGKATIVGDRSAGAVMTSIYRRTDVGFTKLLPFGMSVTIADVIMEDGNRLENIGVTPEFFVLPSGADLAAGRDPQMTKALHLAGIQMDPERAARLFENRD